MKIAVLKERRAGETRVAATPDTIKKMVAAGLSVNVEAGAGETAGVTDDAYAQAGASVTADAAATLADATVVLKVQRPQDGSGKNEVNELAMLPSGAAVIGMLAPYASALDSLAATGVSAFSMELCPRITRAQTMDVLSSQSNLAGYRAVLEAAAEFGRAFPMMMTAAGTVAPAKVMVLGAGVAGLQAIATARRLGAVVTAFDVRAAAKEQVQSLGASFVEVDAGASANAETAGGYAKEMDDAYKARQAAKIAETVAKQDIAIATALIPGRAAPVLITAEMVASMRPGSVIVDLAAENGGNCALTKAGKTVVSANGVKIIGPINMAGKLPIDASALYSRNLWAFLQPLIDKETKGLKIDLTDEIVKATLLTQNGAIVHPNFQPKPAA
jgi:NAD(P) transhydrogenase subunit alpha